MAIGRVNTGGGGTGGTLVVTGVAGDTVTVSKDEKVYTRSFNSLGKAVFKGLSSGTWTVTMTNGEQTATRTVTITADYAVTIAYFAATINVTYPAGSTCTATDGVTTLTAPDTSGTWACIAPAVGTWTVSCTNGSLSRSGTVSITTNGQVESLTLIYELILLDGGSSAYGWSVAYRNTISERHGSKTSAGLFSGDDWAYNFTVFTCNSAVDFSKYKTLCATFNQANIYGSDQYETWGIASERGIGVGVRTTNLGNVSGLSSSYNFTNVFDNGVARTTNRVLSQVTLQFDITNLSLTGYVVVVFGFTKQSTCTKVWLKP